MTPATRAALRRICQAVIDADEADAVHGSDLSYQAYMESVTAFSNYVPAGTVLELLTALDRAEACVEAARNIYPIRTDNPAFTVLCDTIKEYDAHSRSAGQAGETP